MSVRRVVTGHSPQGKAIVVSDENVSPATVALLPGFAWHQVWGTDRAAQFPDDGTRPQAKEFFPPLEGHRFLVFTVPAGAVTRPPMPEGTSLFAQLEASVPGLARHMEREHPGMHTSDTIDYGYVVSGEVWLELDEGATVCLRAGDTYVQNGTRHAWRNRSDAPCTILVVLIGANRRKP